MTGTLTDEVGAAHPNRRDTVPQRHAASLEIMAGVALVVCTAVAATVVSFGIARADTLAAAPSAGRPFAVAVLLGLLLVGTGGLTALIMSNLPRRH